MPEPKPLLQFEKEVETIIAEVIASIEKGGFTKAQLAQIASELDFFEQLRLAGFGKTVDKYFANYEAVTKDVLALAKKQRVDFAKVNLATLDVIAELDEEYLLRKAASWGAQFKSELAKSVIRGDTITQTAARLKEIPLTDAQTKTVLNTAYSDFNRIATKEVFKGEEDMRYQYVGGTVPNSSDICIDALASQDPEGYTMAEIEAGLSFGGGIVTWSGRVPNYNCGHHWEPIITEFKGEVKLV
jgi:hypothetical protein